MSLSPVKAAALERFAKVLGATAAAAAIGFLSGPDAATVFGKQDAVILAMVLVPILSAAEKAWSVRRSAI